MTNTPCIIRAEQTETWRSVGAWVDGRGAPDFGYLKSEFGSATVPVADCSTRYYDSQLKNDMKMSEYLDYWQGTSEQTSLKRGCLYLKDWHFVRDFANYEAYATPVYFTSDWLNEFWGERTDVKDDCRFVYMGPKGSWTPFHADVFGSYSWSANVCGRKLWHLFPPGNEDALRDSEGKLPYDVTLPECARGDTDKKLGITVTQEAGEVIFVPSGWHHQVHNLEDTISINHNWFNGCNIDVVWKSLLKALDDVEKEICELRDSEGWHGQCQTILKAHHGWNIFEFCWMLETISKKRLQMLGSADEGSGNRDPVCSEPHIIFDLVQVLRSYNEVLRCPPEVLGVVKLNRDIIAEILSVLSEKDVKGVLPWGTEFGIS
ncbi:2-oxoglutarate and iron-dependent oxygenase JMJD4 [Ixodes scapularis]